MIIKHYALYILVHSSVFELVSLVTFMTLCHEEVELEPFWCHSASSLCSSWCFVSAGLLSTFFSIISIFFSKLQIGRTLGVADKSLLGTHCMRNCLYKESKSFSAPHLTIYNKRFNNRATWIFLDTLQSTLNICLRKDQGTQCWSNILGSKNLVNEKYFNIFYVA